jgi:hypothetical protein
MGDEFPEVLSDERFATRERDHRRPVACQVVE